MRRLQGAPLLGLSMMVIARGQAVAEPAPAANHAKPEPAATALAPRHSAVWKWTLGISAAATVSGFAYGFYSYERMNDQVDRIDVVSTYPRALTSEDCGESEGELAALTTDREGLRRACTWHGRVGSASR